MYVTYTAQRSLNTTDSPAHVADSEYTLTVYLKRYDRSRKVERATARSLSGAGQNTYQRGENWYSCQTSPVTGSDLINMREFLDSVEDGAEFVFNDGVSDSTVVLESKGYTETREVQKGGGGTSDYFAFRWKHREV